MFRAGDAHAGVIIILSLIGQILIDYAAMSKELQWIVRIGFPVSALLISGGFFGSATGKQINEPSGLIWLIYIGAVILLVALLILGIELIRNR